VLVFPNVEVRFPEDAASVPAVHALAGEAHGGGRGSRVVGCRNRNRVWGCLGTQGSWLAGEAQGGAEGTSAVVCCPKGT
jgi:hypothetical protein